LEWGSARFRTAGDQRSRSAHLVRVFSAAWTEGGADLAAYPSTDYWSEFFAERIERVPKDFECVR
jgi:hypothetical protein